MTSKACRAGVGTEGRASQAAQRSVLCRAWEARFQTLIPLCQKGITEWHSIADFALIFVKLALRARRGLDLVTAQVSVQAVPSLLGRPQTWSSAGSLSLMASISQMKC